MATRSRRGFHDRFRLGAAASIQGLTALPSDSGRGSAAVASTSPIIHGGSS
eukprot:CAMPEP_0194316180 /NCGR_PEP_ID=MMETSP0171-20130528/12994_1 /TAXON_ID=218684 /ORGANISM="Corethron pennatum, Strain L29A3" /LENGTH=50 /DNA_ID=CAMNT_0039072329 /DNA_START=249 /DNA_END=398 /DNA_ORIENTATION=-